MESTVFQHAGANGIRLIETLGWDGAQLVRLDLHLARLDAGAAQLGYACDISAVRAALVNVGQGPPARMRLTLGGNGNIDVTSTPMPPAKPLWNVGLSHVQLDSRDPFLRLKSTHRPAYDAARAALPDCMDEVILLNQAGEVADGSITTVFFDRGAGLRTPPLTSGALPGVLRASMAVAEERLLPLDLAHVKLWLGNSLRGLIPAVWVPS